ncbi:hypothetical protein [Rhodoferax sp.]|uniref:tetratricopeptide repeat protein n=1 Tax=Rhodoferax sp. TaxID=50421 RepID=UPI00260D0D78|nr:hypothetical protein [Rhodoferax sp.]
MYRSLKKLNFVAPQRLVQAGLIARGLMLCLGLACASPHSQAAPRTPRDDAEVLARLPTRPGDASTQHLAALRAQVAQTPTDAEATRALAQAYFDQAMAQGDPRYIGYAQASLQPFAKTMTAELLLVRGQLKQYSHQFEAALADFAAALQANPQLAQAQAWRGAIFLVQANYPAAREVCQALHSLGRTALGGACQGLLQAYTGDLGRAQATLQQALNVSTDADSQLWLHTRLGEVAHWRGQPVQAEQHFKAALALGLDDGYLLAAWSDFLLDTARPAEVVQLLKPWEASDSLLLRLAQAEQQLKLPAAAAHRQAMANRFEAARLRGDVTHRAEEARFEMHLRANPQAALTLAQANYQVQREPRDARILLEAALAAQAPAQAQAALDWLRNSGFEDTRLQSMAQTLNTLTP